MRVKKIVIVGGGSSGWITASILSKNKCNFDITLVESNTIPTIAVGESTQQDINKLLDLLELNDKEWMPKCDATYKNSIRFVDFSVKGEKFQYPFGPFDYGFSPDEVMTWFALSVTDKNFKNDTFARFVNSNTFLADYNKQTYNEENVLLNFNFKNATAYHINATLFGKALKETVALKNKVTHVIGTVNNVVFDESGNVTKLLLDEDWELSGDIFIDCTGFSSFLLEQKMNLKHHSFKDVLPNDSVVCSPISYTDREKQLKNYTDCTALSSGWCWNTPLWERMGSGYVYSSDFLTKEQAEEEFVQYLTNRGESTDDLNIRHIQMKTGKKEKAWVKNVIGVGLSYSFIEPLESTGLWTTHNAAMQLLEILERREGFISKVDIDGFNFFCNFETEHLKTFIIEHYALSMRDDSDYWKYVTNEMDFGCNVLNENLKVNRHYEEFINSTYSNCVWDTRHSGVLYIAAGMGYKPASKRKIEQYVSQGSIKLLNEAKKAWSDYEYQVKKYLKKLPSSYEFLKKEIYS